MEEYKEAEKALRNRIRNAKRTFEKKIADAGNDANGKRRFYSYVKSKTKGICGVGPLKRGDGQIASEDGEMAEILNGFFASVFTREDTNDIPEPKEKFRGGGVTKVKITGAKVKAKIRALRTGAAAGPDGIGPQLLKELVDQVSSPLANIMNKSIEEEVVPQDWLMTNVTPIFKEGQEK